MFGGLIYETVQSVHDGVEDMRFWKISYTLLVYITGEQWHIMSRSLGADWPGLHCYALAHHEYMALLIPYRHCSNKKGVYYGIESALNCWGENPVSFL